MINIYSLDKKHVEGVATLGAFYGIRNKSKNTCGYLRTILADDGFLYYTDGHFLIRIPCESISNGCYSVHSQSAKELSLIQSKLNKDELPNYPKCIAKATANPTFFTDFSAARINSPADIVAVFTGFCFFKNFASIDKLRSFDEKFLKPLFKEHLNFTVGAVSADQILLTYNGIIITVMGIAMRNNRYLDKKDTNGVA